MRGLSGDDVTVTESHYFVSYHNGRHIAGADLGSEYLKGSRLFRVGSTSMISVDVRFLQPSLTRHPC